VKADLVEPSFIKSSREAEQKIVDRVNARADQVITETDTSLRLASLLKKKQEKLTGQPVPVTPTTI
jgi:hypothetical protein